MSSPRNSSDYNFNNVWHPTMHESTPRTRVVTCELCHLLFEQVANEHKCKDCASPTLDRTIHLQIEHGK